MLSGEGRLRGERGAWFSACFGDKVRVRSLVNLGSIVYVKLSIEANRRKENRT
jgi:hypothetical protein